MIVPKNAEQPYFISVIGVETIGYEGVDVEKTLTIQKNFDYRVQVKHFCGTLCSRLVYQGI